MGVMRNLPDAHPVYKLLRPHFRYTMAINAQARESLINDGGIIDQQFAIGGEGRREFMRRAGRDYSIHWANIVRSANERKVDDAKLLPGYYYRDDGLNIWNAISLFVNRIINEFYSSDADVISDIELQNFAEDLHVNGFPANGGEQGHGFPKKIKSTAELVELCTLIMFTGSAQHSCVNFGQYDMYSYVPNATSGMRLPLPAQKGNADAATLVQILPDKKATSSVIGMVYMLSQYSKDEVCKYACMVINVLLESIIIVSLSPYTCIYMYMYFHSAILEIFNLSILLKTKLKITLKYSRKL